MPVLLYLLFTLISVFSVFWSNTPSEAIFEGCKQILAFTVFIFSVSYFKRNSSDNACLLPAVCGIIVAVELGAVLMQLSNTNLEVKDAIYSITGINSHKNLCSSFLFLILFFVLLSFHKASVKTKWLLSITVIATLSLLIFLRTKAVFLGIGAAGISYGLFILIAKRKIQIASWRYVVPVVLFISVFILYAAPVIIEKALEHNESVLKHKTDTTGATLQGELDNERLMLWHKTYSVIRRYPLLGCGSGNWQINYQESGLNGLYRAEDLNYTFQRPHNDWLWILSENGIIGFSLFASLIVWLLFLLISNNHGKARHVMHRKELAFSWIIGYMVISFFDFPKERPEHLLLSNMLFGFTYAIAIKADNNMPFVSLNKTAMNMVMRLTPLILAIVLVTGIYRIKGEYLTYQMYHYKNSNNLSETIKTGKQAINSFYTIDPTSVPLEWYIGNAYAKQNLYSEALSSFKKALKLNPYNRNVLNDLGSAFMMNHQPDSAKYYYLKSASVSPRFDDAKLNLAAVFIQEKNYTAADSVLNTLLHDSDKRTAYQNMVNAMLGKQ